MSNEIAEKSSSAFLEVKPKFHKGGKGRFTRLASPCYFKLEPGGVPTLSAGYVPPGTVWLALLATVVTAVLVQVIAQITGFMAGPGLLIWYLIIRHARKKEIEIDLANSKYAVCDDERQEISIFGIVEGKETWFTVKPDEYDTALDLLKEVDGISVERRKLQSAQLTMIIVLVILLALVALVWISAVQSM